MKHYRTEIQQYTTDTNVFSHCNSLAFINSGAVSVTVDKFVLASGAALSIDGNENEINTTNYRISFNGATNGVLTIIRKYYI
jgi:hypothetical protein